MWVNHVFYINSPVQWLGFSASTLLVCCQKGIWSHIKILLQQPAVFRGFPSEVCGGICPNSWRKARRIYVCDPHVCDTFTAVVIVNWFSLSMECKCRCSSTSHLSVVMRLYPVSPHRSQNSWTQVSRFGTHSAGLQGVVVWDWFWDFRVKGQAHKTQKCLKACLCVPALSPYCIVIHKIAWI